MRWCSWEFYLCDWMWCSSLWHQIVEETQKCHCGTPSCLLDEHVPTEACHRWTCRSVDVPLRSTNVILGPGSGRFLSELHLEARSAAKQNGQLSTCVLGEECGQCVSWSKQSPCHCSFPIASTSSGVVPTIWITQLEQLFHNNKARISCMRESASFLSYLPWPEDQ